MPFPVADPTGHPHQLYFLKKSHRIRVCFEEGRKYMWKGIKRYENVAKIEIH
jgi:hypothetical protein